MEKITLTIKAEDRKNFVSESMKNYPEFSFCLYCTKYDYGKGIYVFFDEDENKKHTITVDQIAEKGFPIFLQMIIDKKLFLDGIDFANFLRLNTDEGMEKALCMMDSIALDALVQCTIFGDVIYG